MLVQCTLWGNLILGPTARDVHKPETQRESADDIMRFVLSKSRQLVPEIDAKLIIHSFAGARAKSDRGDWIIERAQTSTPLPFFNVAGIDSPGLAGSPAIAVHVVRELLGKQGGLELAQNAQFNAFRRPTIFAKKGWKGLKLHKVPAAGQTWTLSADERAMRSKVVCKCEKVPEWEIVDAMSRCGVSVDTTQAIRRRTRAGMGYCQADVKNCNCELFVAHIIAAKKGKAVKAVGRRPWPATSLLKQRWLNEQDKEHLGALAQ